LKTHKLLGANQLALSTPVFEALKKVAAGAGANAAGQVIIIVCQFVMVPLLLYMWGTERYGTWIVLTTVPSYLTLMDLGFGIIASNRVISARAHSHGQAANTTFATLVFFTLCSCGVIGVIGVIILAIFQPQIGGFDGLGTAYSTACLAVLIFYSILYLANSTLFSGLRGVGHYVRASWINTAAIGLENLAVMTLALLGGGIFGALLGLASARLLAVLLLGRYLRFEAPELSWDVRNASVAEFRIIIAPALATFAFPAGTAISSQGILLVFSIVLGAESAAAFNIVRTLSRMVFQSAYMLPRAAMAEYTHAFVSGDRTTAKKIREVAFAGFFYLALPGLAAFAVFGPAFIAVWTHSAIAFPYAGFAMVAVATAAHTYWQFAAIFSIATHRHQRVSFFLLGSVLIELAGCYFVAQKAGLLAALGVVIAFESLMCAALLCNERFGSTREHA
jgi:O-antigen/teichoic acid export membrane protein